MRNWLTGIPLIICFLLMPMTLMAQDWEQRYQQSADAFHTLRKLDDVPPHAWRTVSEGFFSVFETYHNYSRGADALYSSALSLIKAYKSGGTGQDLREALDRFEQFVRVYPKHQLADDSLMHVGIIQISEYNDPQRALETYSRILKAYPTGDQAGHAKSELARLSPGDHHVARQGPAKPKRSANNSNKPVSTVRQQERTVTAKAQTVAFSESAPPPAVSPGARTSPKPDTQTESGTGEIATLKRLQYWSASKWTRIILTTDQEVSYKHEQLPARKGRRPRIYLDLQQTRPSHDLQASNPVGDALVKNIRISRFTSKTTRVVFDLEGIDSYKVQSLNLPFEKKIVIDLIPRPVRKNPEIQIARKQPKSQLSTTVAIQEPTLSDRSLKRALGLKVKNIVIDPGHGGKDPGAIANGIQEKILALKISRALKRVFQEKRPDINVYLTREDDRYIPLDQRPLIAKRKNADLFISIHLNAHRVERFSGIETYFLNLTTDASALRVAARENASTEKQVGGLSMILRDLLRDTNILESSKLARTLQASLISELKAEHPVRDLGVKQAPFMVLIGAEMPSVLVEAGFVTNRNESRKLRDNAYINQIAEGIFNGLKNYIQEQNIAFDEIKPTQSTVSRDNS